jgi:cell wall-associated NlpC family hydrolase
MSIDTSMADVMTRIQDIQSRFASMMPATSTVSGSATDDQFAAALDAAGGTSLSGTSSTTQTSMVGTTVSAGVSGSDVVADARKYLGVKYVWGGTNPASGLDCSGLVQRVYGDLGISLPRVSAAQAKVGVAVPSLADAQPGDLLAFGNPVHHIAIYVGNGQMIEAAHPGTRVRVSSVDETPTAIRRVLPTGSGSLNALDTVSGAQTSFAGVPASSSSTMQQRLTALAPLFQAAEQKYHLPSGLLAAVAQVESSGRADAVSPAGAEGLMQIMPGTARGLGIDPMDPVQAVDGAARLLARNLKAYGSLDVALAAYNAGGGAVHKYGGIPPYPETKAYVKKVTALMGGNA